MTSARIPASSPSARPMVLGGAGLRVSTARSATGEVGILPLDGLTRSRIMLELELEAFSEMGKVMLRFARPGAAEQIPKDRGRLKEILEVGSQGSPARAAKSDGASLAQPISGVSGRRPPLGDRSGTTGAPPAEMLHHTHRDEESVARPS